MNAETIYEGAERQTRMNPTNTPLIPEISIHNGTTGFQVGIIMSYAPLRNGKPIMQFLGHVANHQPLAVGEQIKLREQGIDHLGAVTVAPVGSGLAMYAHNPVKTYYVLRAEVDKFSYVYTVEEVVHP